MRCAMLMALLLSGCAGHHPANLNTADPNQPFLNAEEARTRGYVDIASRTLGACLAKHSHDACQKEADAYLSMTAIWADTVSLKNHIPLGSPYDEDWRQELPQEQRYPEHGSNVWWRVNYCANATPGLPTWHWVPVRRYERYGYIDGQTDLICKVKP